MFLKLSALSSIIVVTCIGLLDMSLNFEFKFQCCSSLFMLYGHVLKIFTLKLHHYCGLHWSFGHVFKTLSSKFQYCWNLFWYFNFLNVLEVLLFGLCFGDPRSRSLLVLGSMMTIYILLFNHQKATTLLLNAFLFVV